MKVKIVFGI